MIKLTDSISTTLTDSISTTLTDSINKNSIPQIYMTSSLIRETKQNKTSDTRLALYSLANKLNSTPDKKIQFTQILNYLNIALRSRYSGFKKHHKIRYFDCTSLKGNIKITIEGVMLALEKVISNITHEEAYAIIAICTHSHASFDSVASYTKTAQQFMKSIKVTPNYMELNHIRSVLDSNLKIKFKNKNFYEILFLCANNNLDNINLENVDLSNLNMKNLSLKNANLKNATLIRTNLENADFENANLENIDLNGSSLKNANFKKTNLQKSNLQCTLCSEAIFDEANLNSSNMEKGDFSNTSFKKTKLSNTNMQNMILQNAKFNSAILEGANLYGADLLNTFMFNCNMKKVNINNTKLIKTVFKNSNFSEANMKNLEIEDADCSESIFFKTDLSGSTFKNVCLNDIDLTGAQLQHINIIYDICDIDDSFIVPEFFDIGAIKILGADFSGAKLPNIFFDISFSLNNREDSKKLLSTLNSFNDAYLNKHLISSIEYLKNKLNYII